MSPDDGDDPVAISELLDRVLGGLGAPQAATVAGVFGAWEEVVGPGVAAHARPVRVDGGRLVVAADDPVWATELRYRAPRLAEQVREALRSDEITHIEVVSRARE